MLSIFPSMLPVALILVGLLGAHSVVRLLVALCWVKAMKAVEVPPDEIAAYIKGEAHRDYHQVLTELVRSWRESGTLPPTPPDLPPGVGG